MQPQLRRASQEDGRTPTTYVKKGDVRRWRIIEGETKECNSTTELAVVADVAGGAVAVAAVAGRVRAFLSVAGCSLLLL